MKTWRFKIASLGIGALCLAALPALGDVSSTPNHQSYPEPGALNYVEGSAYLQGQPLNNQNVGASEMNPGEVLHTGDGKAEVLLTPGVFLRVNDNSSVKMISPDISNTKVALLEGDAAMEVDEIYPQNNLQIVDNGVTTRLTQRGFYEFLSGRSAGQPGASPANANLAKVLVFSGKAEVETGDGHHQDVSKHREMALVPDAVAKAQKFDTDDAQDSLVNWSKLRSQYLSEQNQQVAETYGAERAGYPGWYWNPLGMGWGWGPGWGAGFGFWGYPGPVFYGGRYYGHYSHFDHGYHGHPGVSGGFHGRTGFRGGAVGGFHGRAAGGFHGGGRR